MNKDNNINQHETGRCKKCGCELADSNVTNLCESCKRKKAAIINKFGKMAVGAVWFALAVVLPNFLRKEKTTG